MTDEMDHILLIWYGSQLSTHLTVVDGPDFDIVLPDEPPGAATADVEVVPCAAVEEAMLATLGPDPALRVAADVLAGPVAEGKVSFLGPPPPMPISAVRERLTTEPFFAQRAAAVGVDLASARLVPDSVRAKGWKVLASVYETVARQHDARWIPPPPESLDENGLLPPPYWGDDVSHASRAYGRLYFEKIFAHVAGGAN